MRFFVLLELLTAVVGWLLSGRNPVGSKSVWVLVAPLLAGLFVPALRASALLTSVPAVLALALVVAALAGSRRPASRLRAGAAGLGVAAAAFGLLRAFGPERSAHSHVFEVLSAKLRHLGRLPADPNEMSFDARLLWQGPFDSLAADAWWPFLGQSLVLGTLGFFLLCRSRRSEQAPRSGFEPWFAFFTLSSVVIAWLFGRTVILPGLCLPVLAALGLARSSRRALPGWTFGVLTALQGLSFAEGLRFWPLAWYAPPGRQEEIAQLVDWIGEHVDPTEPIAGDFMNSPALLYRTGNPIVLQPKYETEASRRKAQSFLETFFQDTPQAFLELVRERFQCRYLLVDRYTLGALSWYTAGLASPEPRPGTAAALFLSQDDELLRSLPEVELLYRSPPSIRTRSRTPYDFFRVYRLR